MAERRQKEGRESRHIVAFLEDYGDVVLSHLECETLGRLAAASKRCLALNRTGTLGRRWGVEALAALEAQFEVADVARYEGGAWAEEWADFANGGDPRINGIRDKAEAKATWGTLPVTTRLATLIAWQAKVAKAVRAIPEDFDGITEFVLAKRDPRFEEHYDFSGYPDDDDDEDLELDDDVDRCSPGMKLCLKKLAYMTSCEIYRCSEFGNSHAGEVYLHGWDRRADSFRKKRCFDDVLTGEIFVTKKPENTDDDDDDDSDDDVIGECRAWRRKHAITKYKAWFLASHGSWLVHKLAPFLGHRVCAKKLAICRGDDDLPVDWQDHFQPDPAFDELVPFEPAVAFLDSFQWELSNKKQRSLSKDEASKLLNVLRALNGERRQNFLFDFFLSEEEGSTFDFLENNVGRDTIPFVFEHIDAPDIHSEGVAFSMPPVPGHADSG